MMAGVLASINLGRFWQASETLAELGAFSQRVTDAEVGERRIDVIRKWVAEMEAYIEENK